MRKWARVRAVSPLHDPEARKEPAVREEGQGRGKASPTSRTRARASPQGPGPGGGGGEDRVSGSSLGPPLREKTLASQDTRLWRVRQLSPVRLAPVENTQDITGASQAQTKPILSPSRKLAVPWNA